MKLSILFFKGQERPYLLKREDGEYDQHAHFFKKEEAIPCRKIIDKKEYPRDEKYKIAVKRILTEEEFKRLNKKPHYINVNKGVRNGKIL